MKKDEIIKAWECCAVPGSCEYCPLKSDKRNCVTRLSKYSLDLLARQKADNKEINVKEKILKAVVDNTEKIMHCDNAEKRLMLAQSIEILSKSLIILSKIKEEGAE